MTGIGKLLREKREEQGLSLADIENETKIRQSYLEALEAEAFDKLPGNIYIYGFLRNYASFLGLDASEIVMEVKSLLEANEDIKNDGVIVDNSFRGRKPFGIGKALKIIAIFLACILVSVYIYGHFKSKTEMDEVMITIPEEIPVESPGEDLIGKVEKKDDIAKDNISMDKIEIIASVADLSGARCWVEIKSDNETAFSGILERGEARKFVAKEHLWIKIGNPGVLSITYNGEDIGELGPGNKVITMEFPQPSSNEKY